MDELAGLSVSIIVESFHNFCMQKSEMISLHTDTDFIQLSHSGCIQLTFKKIKLFCFFSVL